MNKKSLQFYPHIFIVALMVVGFILSYNYDNKYSIQMPLPQQGVLNLTESDIKNNKPIFLIDDWLYHDYLISSPTKNLKDGLIKYTYIGEYSNFARGGISRPLGVASYVMSLYYNGNPQIVVVDFPELFSEYAIYFDGELLDSGRGGSRIYFELDSGFHQLTVETKATEGYYAGMYYPPMLGTPELVDKIESRRTFLYAAAILSPIVLAIYSFFLWRVGGKQLRDRFAYLCISFSVYLSYYFVQLWKLPFHQYWYLVEDISFYAFLYCAVSLSVDAVGLELGFDKKSLKRLVAFITLFFPAVEVVLYLVTPIWADAITAHSIIQDCYRVMVFLILSYCSMQIARENRWESYFLLSGNAALGLGLLVNLVFSNLYEPIYGMWQFEWCGILLVIIFAAMMISQNKRIISENNKYKNKLEEMVMERTHQLSCLLEERRAFFADMAHDLKAPIFATNSYIKMIRQNSVNLDDQLMFCIAQVEQKQEEIERRVLSLNEINAFDRIEETEQVISLNSLLSNIGHNHTPEAAVNGIHLVTIIPSEQSFIRVKKERLLLAFENLIYNALRFTESGGYIKIAVETLERQLIIYVEDSGCGISEEELPKIFDRFFIGENNKNCGSGLGLYIAKQVVIQEGGDITATSVLGLGTTFKIILPRYFPNP